MPIFKKCYEYKDPEIVKAAGIYPYFRPIDGYRNPHVTVEGKEKIMIGSNNYLGLSHHPEVLERAKKAIDHYGSGCTGSRFLNGNMDLHDELELHLARFLGKESAVVYSTGFLANLGTIPTITSRHSVIFSDRENHASITEGCNLSFAKVVRFPHNDMEALAGLLDKYQNHTEKLIISDGVFSMNGRIANLPGLVELAKQHKARLYIDDAHSLGVLGKKGRGTGEYYGLADDIDIIMGTFSKSLASIGGFVAGPKEVMSYVKHHARALIFSASIPPASVAVAKACLEILEEQPELMDRLMRNTRKAREGLQSLGFDVCDGDAAIVSLKFPGDRESTFTIAQALFDEGLFSTPILPPAVPQGMTMIRTSYMASHTDEDITKVIEIFEKVGKRLKLV